jgi:hypothetical protein
MADYLGVGGFAHALSNHANEAFADLDRGQQRIAELMFRRLCERGEGGTDGRRPTPVGEIQAICAAALAETSLSDVMAVANVLRESRYGFLTPAEPELLDAGTVLDITHESLIRRWDRLDDWSEKETESAREYRYLEQAAQRWPEQGALWGTPDLETALKWKEEEKPSKAWATRYGGDFDKAEAFLNLSQEQQACDKARERERKQAEMRRALARTRTYTALIVGAVAAGSVVLLYWLAYIKHTTRYYEAFTNNFRAIVPVGQLSREAVRHRSESLKVVTRGFRGDIVALDAVDSADKLNPHNHVGTYLLTPEQSGHPCHWEFVWDENKHLVYETAWDEHRNMLWGFTYAPFDDAAGSRPRRWASFVSPHDGQPMPRQNSQAQIIEFTYDERGHEIRRIYLDRQDQLASGPWGEFGRATKYNDDHVTEETSLDIAGHPLNNPEGIASYSFEYYPKSNNIKISTALDGNDRPVLNEKYGYSIVHYWYDNWGNETEHRYFDTDGKTPVTNKAEGAHIVRVRYENNTLKVSYFDVTGQPVDGPNGKQAAH